MVKHSICLLAYICVRRNRRSRDSVRSWNVFTATFFNAPLKERGLGWANTIKVFMAASYPLRYSWCEGAGSFQWFLSR